MASSSSSGHDDFLSPQTSTQGTAGTFSSPQLPVSKSPYQASPAKGPGSQTPPKAVSTLPQSSPPVTASWVQSPSLPPANNLPQTPPVPFSSLPQSQSSTAWPQAPPTPPSLYQSSSSSSVPRPSPQLPYQYSSSVSPPQVQGGITPVTPPATVEPVKPHWFYQKGNSAWKPFSYIDSENLEQALKTSSAGGDRIVATDGGRYDVNLDKRLRYPLYWEEDVSVIRRCTWFHKGDGESKLVPYKEDMAARLEVLCLSKYI